MLTRPWFDEVVGKRVMTLSAMIFSFFCFVMRFHCTASSEVCSIITAGKVSLLLVIIRPAALSGHLDNVVELPLQTVTPDLDQL